MPVIRYFTLRFNVPFIGWTFLFTVENMNYDFFSETYDWGKARGYELRWKGLNIIIDKEYKYDRKRAS